MRATDESETEISEKGIQSVCQDGIHVVTGGDTIHKSEFHEGRKLNFPTKNCMCVRFNRFNWKRVISTPVLIQFWFIIHFSDRNFWLCTTKNSCQEISGSTLSNERTRATAATEKKMAKKKLIFVLFCRVFISKKTLTVGNWIKMKRTKKKTGHFVSSARIHDSISLQLFDHFSLSLVLATFVFHFSRCRTFSCCHFLNLCIKFSFSHFSVHSIFDAIPNQCNPSKMKNRNDINAISIRIYFVRSFHFFLSTVVRERKKWKSQRDSVHLCTFRKIKRAHTLTYFDDFSYFARSIVSAYPFYFSHIFFSSLFLSTFLPPSPSFARSLSLARSVSFALSRSICAFCLRAVDSSFLLLAFAGLCSLIVW